MGGVGSGIKGHRTYGDVLNTIKEFDKDVGNVKKGLEKYLGTMVNEFNVPILFDFPDDMPEDCPAYTEIDLSGKPQKIVLVTKVVNADPDKKKKIIAHEIGHCLFQRLSVSVEGLSEGMAVLVSSLVSKAPIEADEYKVWAIGMAETLEIVAKSKKMEVGELLEELHSLDKVTQTQRILGKGVDTEKEYIDSLKPVFESMVKAVTDSYEENDATLMDLNKDFAYATNKFKKMLKVEKAVRAGALSGELGYTPMPEVYDGMGPVKTKKNEKKILDLVTGLYKEIQDEVDEEWDRLYGVEKGGPGSGIKGHVTVKDVKQDRKPFKHDKDIIINNFTLEGGHLEVMENSPHAEGYHSVVDFYVEEKSRKKGIGGLLVDAMIKEYGTNISAQTSNEVSVGLFYKKGFRLKEKMGATLEEAIEMYHKSPGSISMIYNKES
jgi:GNAT superfamily N-acetyltransferase